MILVKITPKMRENAHEKAKKIPHTISNSIRKGEGRFVGCLGEELLAAHFGRRWKSKPTYHYDGILDGQTLVDVKTKLTTVEPKPDYNCTVAAANTTQECDEYWFVRIHNSYNYGWILGFCSKIGFFQRAEFAAKGDPDGDRGWTFKADCYNMKVKDLFIL